MNCIAAVMAPPRMRGTYVMAACLLCRRAIRRAYPAGVDKYRHGQKVIDERRRMNLIAEKGVWLSMTTLYRRRKYIILPFLLLQAKHVLVVQGTDGPIMAKKYGVKLAWWFQTCFSVGQCTESKNLISKR